MQHHHLTNGCMSSGGSSECFIDDWTVQHKNRGWKNCNTVRSKFKGSFQGKKGECLLLPVHVKICEDNQNISSLNSCPFKSNLTLNLRFPLTSSKAYSMQKNQFRNIYKTSKLHTKYSLDVMTLDLFWVQCRITLILNIHYTF